MRCRTTTLISILIGITIATTILLFAHRRDFGECTSMDSTGGHFMCHADHMRKHTKDIFNTSDQMFIATLSIAVLLIALLLIRRHVRQIRRREALLPVTKKPAESYPNAVSATEQTT